MLKERVTMQKKDAVAIRADFGGGGVEGYAMAFLKLYNNAREYPHMLWHIENTKGDDVIVVCPPNAADRVKNFLTNIITKYDKGEDGKPIGIPIGKVLDSWETKIGVFERDYESTARYGTDEYEKDMDKAFEVEFFMVGDDCI